MPDSIKIRRALISVYDKAGIVEFARTLHEEFGVEVISTGGTAKTLTDAGIPVTLVEDITGFPEMLDGRVKTLHPKIHAAILADRDNPEHMRQLAEQGIEPIDMVVVNLYPFEETIRRPDCTFEEALEMIDIGGPCLLRAAAKNHRHVLVVCDPALYDLARIVVSERGAKPSDFRRQVLAFNAFARTNGYDGGIASWLSRPTPEEPATFQSLRYCRGEQTSYGENPHQRGTAYSAWDAYGADRLIDTVREDAAVSMSFNNYADASAALELCADLARSQLWDRSPDRSPEPKVWDRSPDRSPEPKVWDRSPDRSLTDETFHRRHLPHIERPGGTYFVTFRLGAGELSAPERDRVVAACRFWHGRKMTLHAVCVMSDHVHMLLTPHESSPGQWVSLTELLKSIKGYTGHEICRARGRAGPLWQDESFDRIMRNAREYQETWDYMYANPCTAGLVDDPEKYPWFWHSEAGFQELVQGEGVTGREIGPTEVSQVTGQETGPTEVSQVTGQETGPTKVSQVTGRETGPTKVSQVTGRETGPTKVSQVTGRETGPTTVCCFIKHTNACGAAVARPTDETEGALHAAGIEAYRKAYLGDPNAAMGGVLAVNFDVSPEFAAAVMETYQRWGKPLKETGAAHAPGAFFIEVWLAPSFDEEAVRIIRGEIEGKPQKEWGKRVRLLEVGDLSAEPDPNEMDFKRVAGGLLMQTRDLVGLNEEQWRVVTERKPTDAELADLRLAWLICKHTKSNAITICRDGMLIGNGAGQMSRVMSCRIATWLANDNGHTDKLAGAAAASDGFFPFRDGPDVLAEAGVTAIIQPGGSKRDDEVISAANARGLAMVLTGTRHFRH